MKKLPLFSVRFQAFLRCMRAMHLEKRVAPSYYQTLWKNISFHHIFTSITLTELGTNGEIGEEIQRQFNWANRTNAGNGERIPVSSNGGWCRKNNIVTLSLIIQITLITILATGDYRHPVIINIMCRLCRYPLPAKQTSRWDGGGCLISLNV